MNKILTKTKNAFTLIELLVVIAIIGILSGVVIANLNSARNKAQDAAISGQLNQLGSIAAVYYDDNGYKYSSGAVASILRDVCPSANTGTFANTLMTNTEVTKLVDANRTASGFNSICALGASGVGSQSWAMAARLRQPNASGSPIWICRDSSGAAKEIVNTVAPTGVTTAFATTFFASSTEAVCP